VNSLHLHRRHRRRRRSQPASFPASRLCALLRSPARDINRTAVHAYMPAGIAKRRRAAPRTTSIGSPIVEFLFNRQSVASPETSGRQHLGLLSN